MYSPRYDECSELMTIEKGVNNQSIQILMYKNILLRCVFQVEGNSDDFALIFSFAMESMRRSETYNQYYAN